MNRHYCVLSRQSSNSVLGTYRSSINLPFRISTRMVDIDSSLRIDKVLILHLLNLYWSCPTIGSKGITFVIAIIQWECGRYRGIQFAGKRVRLLLLLSDTISLEWQNQIFIIHPLPQST